MDTHTFRDGHMGHRDRGDPEKQLVNLHFTGGQICVWHPEEVDILRTKHHIIGSLIGALPGAPRQNAHLGLPLQLMPEEAAVLLQHGVARLVTMSLAKPSSAKVWEFNQKRTESIKEQKSQWQRYQAERREQLRDVIEEGKLRKKERKLRRTKDTQMEQTEGKDVADRETDKGMKKDCSLHYYSCIAETGGRTMEQDFREPGVQDNFSEQNSRDEENMEEVRGNRGRSGDVVRAEWEQLERQSKSEETQNGANGKEAESWEGGQAKQERREVAATDVLSTERRSESRRSISSDMDNHIPKSKEKDVGNGGSSLHCDKSTQEKKNKEVKETQGPIHFCKSPHTQEQGEREVRQVAIAAGVESRREEIGKGTGKEPSGAREGEAMCRTGEKDEGKGGDTGRETQDETADEMQCDEKDLSDLAAKLEQDATAMGALVEVAVPLDSDCFIDADVNDEGKTNNEVEDGGRNLKPSSKKGDDDVRDGGCSVQLFTAEPIKSEIILEAPPGAWHYPSNEREELRYRVFVHFWEMGYFLTSGTKFGGDFLVYPGDPFLFHSYFIVVCIPFHKQLSALDLVSHGRLGTFVKKTVVLCSVDSSKGVTCTSLQWSGIS